jgi:hypothetical protein
VDCYRSDGNIHDLVSAPTRIFRIITGIINFF